MAMQGFNAPHLRLVNLVGLQWIVQMSSDSCGMGTVDTWGSMHGHMGAFV